jgi:preprotein translocase subunit SecF
MEFFRIKRDIPFMRYALIFNVISLITFLVAVVSLATRGLHLGVDFTGGTVMELSYQQAPDLLHVREAMVKMGFVDPSVQNFGTSRDVLIRLPVKEGLTGSRLSDRVFNQICQVEARETGGSFETVCPQAIRSYCDRRDQLKSADDKAKFDQDWKENGGPEYDCNKPVAGKNEDAKVEMRRVEFVGPQVGAELMWNGALALLFVSFGIVLYLWLRFEWKFGVSAIIANLHDVVIILGCFSVFQWEFSLPVLAAVLAILGYSVNESVVVMDRVRENFRSRRFRTAPVPQIIDNAITSTMSRTIITHGCTQLMVCSMLIFGGETLHYFALALTIGICFGIYSSVLVGSPLLMWLGLRREDLVKPESQERKAGDSGAVV